MLEKTKREARLDWIYRVVFTINLLVVVGGYISYFQAKHQLISPLIPRSILYDITDQYMKASLVSSGLMLAGFWLYSFQKRIAAIVLSILSIAAFEIVFISFRT